MWRPSVFGLSVVYNVYIVAKRCILYSLEQKLLSLLTG